MSNRELWMYDCELVWWDDGDEIFKKKIVKCLVAGDSNTNVMEKLENWYGKDNIDEISIKIIDETEYGIMEISNEDFVK